MNQEVEVGQREIFRQGRELDRRYAAAAGCVGSF
jgi:hypothetical protein